MAKFTPEYIKVICKNILLDFVEAHKFRRHSIFRALCMEAHKESVEFAIKNLKNSRRFRNRRDLLKFCILRAKENFPCDAIYAEFGVYKGESLKILCKELPGDIIYGFDSFAGLPEQWGTVLPKGQFALAKIPKVPSNAKLLVGLFSDTLPGFLKNHPGKFAFIFIDSDLYSSALEVLNLLTDRIVPGTVIVFDEFINIVGWQESEYKALMEWSAAKGIKFDYLAYNAEKALGAGSGVAIIIK